MERSELRGYTLAEITEFCAQAGLKPFRGTQVFQWIQKKGIHAWEEMKNIGEMDRKRLAEGGDIYPLEMLRELRSKDGTRKYLFRLPDGETVECVLMDYERTRHRDRHTLCLSTQVGCAVGCSFCATGMSGFKRDLTPGEIVGQVLDVTRHLRLEDFEFQVTNLVFMGMGEPFLNYEAVMKAIKILNHEQGQNIGMRRMTISTSGIVPKIYQLAEDNPQVGLAVSLHSPDDEVRNHLVPINRRYPLPELMQACRSYALKTHRRVTFEVALMASTATEEFAWNLGELLKGQLGHVNLIPINPVQGTETARPSREQINKVAKVLEQAGIPVSIREEKGTDIEAACGQLRRRWECE